MNEEAQLKRFHDVIDALIDPRTGCPWDKEQTPVSLCEYLIEESHELAAAIRAAKPGHACDEMGDLLFVLLLIARLYEKSGAFSLGDALKTGADKMVRRHPHIFSDSANAGVDDMMKNWAEIKKQEKQAAGDQGGILDSVPDDLPPLTKSYRLHAKAASAGFTWDDEEDVERQVEAEWLELLDARASDDQDAKEHELGDLIFTLTELGRRMGIKAASAADSAANRFKRRFRSMENLAEKKNLKFQELSLDQKDELWEEAKMSEPHSAAAPAVEFAVPSQVPAE